MVSMLTTTASSHSASLRQAQEKDDTFAQTHHTINELGTTHIARRIVYFPV